MTIPWLHSFAVNTSIDVPTLWVLGKPDSGKKSIVEALTSYDRDSSIKGFTTCGVQTKVFDFPSDVCPVLKILITAGIEDSVQNLIEDVPLCHRQSHVIAIAARIMDLNQSPIYETADYLRRITPQRPLLLALTCLHEAYGDHNHPEPYPFTGPPPWCAHNPKLKRLNRAGLKHWSVMKHPASRTVLMDITPASCKCQPTFYGADALFENVVDLLPKNARRLITGWMNSEDFVIIYVIHRYSCLAALAGSLPFGGDEALEVSIVQDSMLKILARLLKRSGADPEFMECLGRLQKYHVDNRATTRLLSVLPRYFSIHSPVQIPPIHCISTAAMGLLYIWYARQSLTGRRPSWDAIRHAYRNKIRTVLDKWPKDFQIESTKTPSLAC